MAARRNAASKSTQKDAAREANDIENLKSLGKYQLKRRIGAGGMGAVYLALDTNLKRTVALKVLPKEKAASATLVKRFEAEAQAAAHLKHDNIVTIYEAGQSDGYLYIALEYIEGTDVYNLIAKRGYLPIKRSVAIIKQVARALQHIHEQGMVHRDIKPSNLLIRRDGTIKLADLGLARFVDEATESNLTRAGTTVGTIDYMAPEQARYSKAADIRSDIYSLGCAWYQMLTGKLPFPDGSLTNKLHAHATLPPPDPRAMNAGVPEGVVAVLHRMLAKSPDDRYQTPAELLEDLENANLSRESVANSVLAALVDETAGEAVISRDPRPPGPNSLPPKRPVTPSPSSRPGLNLSLEPLKYVGLAAAALLVIGLLWWIGLGMSSTLESPGESGAQNPFAQAVDELDLGNPLEPDDGDSQIALNGGDEKDLDHSADASQQAVQDDSANHSTASDGPRQQEETPPPSDSNSANRSDASSTGNRLGRIEPILRKGELGYLPNWIRDREFRFPASSSSKTVSVTAGGNSPGDAPQLESLEVALQQLPDQGGRIELAGDGPFFVGPIRLADRQKIIVTAADGCHPLVVLKPDSAVSTGADRVLHIDGSDLVIQGIQFLMFADQVPSSGELAMVAVSSGNLTVQNCTFTLEGTRPARTYAIAHEAIETFPTKSPSKPPRIFLNRTFVRGDGLTALKVDQPAAEVVTSNCLFASGSAPVLTLADSQSGHSPSQSAGSSSRTIRFASTTALCRDTMFELRSGRDADSPPPTEVVAINSIFAAEADQPDSTLISLVNWPELPKSEIGPQDSRFKNLRWDVRSCLHLGWSALLRTHPERDLEIRTAEAWSQVFGQQIETVQFQSNSWPKTKGSDLSRLEPHTVDLKLLDLVPVQATDGRSPGCLLSVLEAPPLPRLEKLRLLRLRPHLPVDVLENWNPNKILEIDLTKQDLGKTLADADWSSDTLVIASGFGARDSRPIHVVGKRLNLQFVQKPGSPLIISPEYREPSTVTSEEKFNSFIFVKNGSINILDGHFKLPATQLQVLPSWFMHLEEADFSLRNCRVLGPMLKSLQYNGLICWDYGPDSPDARAVDRRPLNRGYIDRCFLSTYGTLMEAEPHRRNLILRNSVFVSLDHLFHFNLTSGSDIDAVLDVKHCTFSAGKSVFTVQADHSRGRSKRPLHFIVEESVFAPPVDAASKRPPCILMSYIGPVREQQQVDWWGIANGFSPAISAFGDRPADMSADQSLAFEHIWKRAWGEERISRLLAGSAGILLEAAFPEKTKITASSFALNTTCQAHRWGAGNRPIGADVKAIDSSKSPSSTANRSPSSRSPSSRTSKRKPEF